MQTHSTTPFGRRSLTLAMVASQASARDFATKPGASAPVVHKWRLFRALTEAKAPLGVTDRALSVLHALLSFHQETALTLPAADPRAEEGDGSAGIVVFPSNRELSIRAHGMAPATLRRHLACLVDAGLIIRRDSPNGKRYARRGQGGEIENAFGFDLTPLVARAEEIENLAEEVRAENKAIRLVRERVTLLRRDIVKMIATGLEEGVSGDWEALHLRYVALSSRHARNSMRRDLEALEADLAAFAREIQNALENHVKLQKVSANESQNGRHIQNQITNSFDLEPGLQQGRGETLQPSDQGSSPPSANANSKPSRAANLPSRHGARSLSRHRGLRQERDQQLARSGDDGGARSFGFGRVAGRLGAGLGGYGRTRRVNRHRRDPATGRGDQERRRLSAGSDGQSQGRGVFAWASVDGAATGQGR